MSETIDDLKTRLKYWRRRRNELIVLLGEAKQSIVDLEAEILDCERVAQQQPSAKEGM